MPDFDKLTVRQLREIGKQAHLLVCAFDSGQRDPTDNAKVVNFQRRVERLREALEAEVSDS